MAYQSIFGIKSVSTTEDTPQQTQQKQVQAKKNNLLSQQRRKKQQQDDAAKAKPKSLLSKVTSFTNDNIVKPTITTAQKSYNTVDAGVTGTVGLATAGVQAAKGNKQAATRTVAATNKEIDRKLDKGAGKKGGFLSSKQASSSGGGIRGVKENFIKPTSQAVSEIAPVVMPIGRTAKGAGLLTKVTRGAVDNAAVGGSTTITNEAIQGRLRDKKSAKETLKGVVQAGAIGGLIPLAGHGVHAGKAVTNTIGAKQLIRDAKTKSLLDKADKSTVRVRQESNPSSVIVKRPNATKLLGTGESKPVQGDSFTMSSQANPDALKRGRQLNLLQKRVTDFQTGKLKITPDEAKADAQKLSELKTQPLINAKVNPEHVKQGLVTPEISKTPIKTLALDASTTSKMDTAKVKQYEKQIKDGEPIEPIVTHKVNGQSFIVDGEHRLQAAKNLGITEVPTVEKVPGAMPVAQATEAPMSPAPKPAQSAAITSPTTTKAVVDPNAPPERGVSKIGQSIQEKAPDKTMATKVDTPTTTATKDHSSRVYQRLKAEHPEDLKDDVSYTAINLKEQAERATKLMVEDKQKLYRVATGQESSPHITSTSANIALAEKALNEGNTKLYGDLIRNRSLAQTRRGQELVSEKASISDNSTSRYVKELLSTRMEQLGKKHTLGIDLRKTSPHEAATATIDREVKQLDLKIRNKQLDTKSALALLDKMECL